MASNNSDEATEASRLQALNADVQDQDDLERAITRKVVITLILLNAANPESSI